MGFFDRMLGKNNNPPKGSSSTAKDRLKMVLTHDRIKVSPEKMKEMKAEIIAIIARYIPEIDPDSVDIALEQSDRYQNKLVAEIPFTKDRGSAPEDLDGNDDLVAESDDDLNITSSEDSIRMRLDDSDIPTPSSTDEDELSQLDEFDMDNDDTLKTRPSDD